MILAWGARVSAEFRRKVLALCLDISIGDPSWLMACMAFETGRTFDPAKRNAASGATGLIQFMGSTAAHLGTSTAQLARMSAEEQLDWVAKYFEPYKGRIQSFTDCYMAILWPAAIGLPDDAVLFSSGKDAYLLNRGLDLNKDGSVTKAEATALVARLYDEGLAAPNSVETEEAELAQPAQPKGGLSMPLIMALLPAVLQLFAPRAQAALQKITGAPADVAEKFAQDVIAKVQDVTGKPDPVQAVAAITADPKPELVQQVEDSALDHLDKLLPVLDKLAEYSKAEWDAEIASQDAAAVRGRADGLDLAPLLAKANLVTVGAILGVLVVIMGIQAWFDADHEPSTALLTLFGPLAGIVFTEFKTLYGYRFGSSRSSGAKDAVIATLSKK